MSDYRGELTRTVDVGSLIAFGTAKPAVFPTCVRSTSDRRWRWTISLASAEQEQIGPAGAKLAETVFA